MIQVRAAPHLEARPTAAGRAHGGLAGKFKQRDRITVVTEQLESIRRVRR
jgi:hypothetical protein